MFTDAGVMKHKSDWRDLGLMLEKIKLSWFYSQQQNQYTDRFSAEFDLQPKVYQLVCPKFCNAAATTLYEGRIPTGLSRHGHPGSAKI